MQTETCDDGRITGELFKAVTEEQQKRKFKEAVKRPGVRKITQEKVGRNDPCPCGSGRKFKKCCLGQEWRDEMTECSVCGQNVRAGVMTEHIASHKTPTEPTP